jgi:ABC-type branched-subunit amino acid transport system ATPase component
MGTAWSVASPALSVEGLKVSFGGVKALGGVSFEVAPGEICGLIGPNGAGKTTLFDVIAGECKPSHGRVVLDGLDVTGLGPTARSQQGIRRTFQRVQPFGWLTVEENILAALEWHGGGGSFLADLVFAPTRRRRERKRREQVDATIERCSLGAVRDECAGSLPIAIARMVEFARATVEPPRVLLLDEPASGLGEQEMEFLGKLIMDTRTATGCAVLLVEHDAHFVMEHCDRVVVLALGSVIANGSPEEIQADVAVQEAYLGQSTG